MTHRKRERVAALQRQVEDTSRRPSKAPAVGPEEQSATATVSQMNMSFARVPVSTEQARPAIQRTPEEEARAALGSGLLTRRLTDWRVEFGLMMTDGDLQPLPAEDRARLQVMRDNQSERTRAPYHSTALVRAGVAQGVYTGALHDIDGAPHEPAKNSVGLAIDPLSEGVVFGSEIRTADAGTSRGQGSALYTTPEQRQERMGTWQADAHSGKYNHLDLATFSWTNTLPPYNEVLSAFNVQNISAIFLSTDRDAGKTEALLQEATVIQDVLNTLGRPVPIWELGSHEDIGRNSTNAIRVLAPAPEPVRPSDGSSSSSAATHADASSSSPQTVGSSAFIDSPAPPLVVPPNMLSDYDDASFAPPAAAQFGRSRRTGF